MQRRRRTSCNKPANKSGHKLLASCLRTVFTKLLEQVWYELLTTWNKLDETIRLVVTRLFQQDWYSLDTKYCYNLVLSTLWQSCYNRSVSELLRQSCSKSDVPVKFVTVTSC